MITTIFCNVNPQGFLQALLKRLQFPFLSKKLLKHACMRVLPLKDYHLDYG